jgi:hypothetical protein
MKINVLILRIPPHINIHQSAMRTTTLHKINIFPIKEIR